MSFFGCPVPGKKGYWVISEYAFGTVHERFMQRTHSATGFEPGPPSETPASMQHIS